MMRSSIQEYASSVCCRAACADLSRLTRRLVPQVAQFMHNCYHLSERQRLTTHREHREAHRVDRRQRQFEIVEARSDDTTSETPT